MVHYGIVNYSSDAHKTTNDVYVHSLKRKEHLKKKVFARHICFGHGMLSCPKLVSWGVRSMTMLQGSHCGLEEHPINLGSTSSILATHEQSSGHVAAF